MTDDVPTAALNAATRRRTEDTRARAREALRRLDRDGHPITFAAVADTAEVSRSLLYRDPDLRGQIEALRNARAIGVTRPPAAERSGDASLHQRLAAALHDNRALRTENQHLRDRLARALGEQRAATIPNRPPGRTIGPCSNPPRPVDDMSLTRTRRSRPRGSRPLQITANVKIKDVRGAARGFRNDTNYAARIRLHAGQPRSVPTTTRIRSYTLTTPA